MLLRCRATVCSLIPSAVAMSRLVRPPATRPAPRPRGRSARRARGRRQHGRAALVGPRAEPGERDPRRPQLHQLALPVAGLPAGRRDRHAGLRRLVRHPQLGPGCPCHAQRGERGRRCHPTASATAPAAVAAAARGSARARHRQLAELVRRRASRRRGRRGRAPPRPGRPAAGSGPAARWRVGQRQGGRRRVGSCPGPATAARGRAAGRGPARGRARTPLRQRVRPAAGDGRHRQIGRLGGHDWGSGSSAARSASRRGGLPRRRAG